ncbi:unnamed protein product [Litomosoides sigmodontis]|uniref:Treslin STD domain-containing protein n=1 Tax=Litomosoides sigmodontis TaxID=42156 RepID=A0A3P6TWN9_LITSI|nr:unnamed protein product [Litomosoides sigmodontis]
MKGVIGDSDASLERMEQQKSFEDVAFELFKNLCPERNFKRDEIPYQTVREIVEKHLNSMDSEKRQLLEARIRGETEQGRSETSSKIDSRGPSPSKPKSVSEYRNLLVADRHHLLPKLEDFNEAQKIHLRYPKNVRKFVRARTERRLAAESNDYVNIVCDEKKLPEVFQPIYDQILRKRKKSLQCYYMIINTLHHYFMRITWSDLVSDLVNEFIEKHIILTCDGLTTKYDREEREVDIFERLREYELMVLLELHLIKKHPERIEETEVVNKLGFLVYVADSVYMKNFLDEIVCDQITPVVDIALQMALVMHIIMLHVSIIYIYMHYIFAHVIPKAIVYIYEELCIKMPLDLENRSADAGASRILEAREVGRRSSRKTGRGSGAMLALERKAAAKTEKEGKHRKHKSDGSSESGSCKPKVGLRARVKQAERISERIAAREKSKKTAIVEVLYDVVECMYVERFETTQLLDKYFNFYNYMVGNYEENEVINKLREVQYLTFPVLLDISRLISFHALLFFPNEDKEIEREKAGDSGGSSSGTISEGDDLGEVVVPATPKSKMKKKVDERVSKDDEDVMQTPLSKLNRIPTRKNEKLAELLEKSLKTQSQQRQQSRKRNSFPTMRGKTQSKKSRISLPQTSSISSLSNVSRTRSARVNLNERFAMMERLNDEASTCSPTTSPAAPQTLVNDIPLDKNIIERYRKRIESVRHSARKGDKNEVFYGRCTSRRNLFDDSTDEGDNEGVSTRSTSCIQKNRSGRSVQTSQKVYMAHALLNVYNTDPLNPPKLPKDAPFKLHRLIRPASKSDKKRLFKFRLRIAREKSGPSSSLVKNSTSCETLETASSKVIKIKSEVVEENSSNGTGIFGSVGEKKLESDSSEKREELFRDPSVRKLSRATNETPGNIGPDSESSIQLPRKNSSRRGKKTSENHHSGISSNKSKTADGSESITREKSPKAITKALGDISEVVPNACINSHFVSQKPCSTEMMEEQQVRKASPEVAMDKTQNDGEGLEILTAVPCRINEKQEVMDVS